jgi:hypothetical protein
MSAHTRRDGPGCRFILAISGYADRVRHEERALLPIPGSLPRVPVQVDAQTRAVRPRAGTRKLLTGGPNGQCHLPTVKVGPQRLSGQKRTEMKYCTQLWIPGMVPGDPGKCGDAVLTNTPMRM